MKVAGIVWLGLVLAALGQELSQANSRAYVVFEQQVAEQLMATLPLDKAPYTGLTWETDLGPGVVSLEGLDEQRGRVALWLTVQVHEQVNETLKATFTGRCGGFPAKRLEGRWAWVLIGRVELRVTAFTVDFEDPAKLDALILETDTEALLKQFPAAAAQ